MSSISIRNPSVSENIKTLLSEDYSSGTNLNVDSSTSYVSGQYILVGELGGEKSEVTSLTATPPTDSSMTVTSLKFPHPKGTPVYYIKWDKYYLQYQTSSVGAWTAYPSMPLDLKYDSLSTEYRDPAATSTYQWKYRYYSSEAGVYSDYSDTISASGWAKNSVGYMVRSVRKIANDPESRTVSDTEIIRFLNAAQDTIYTLYDRWWFLFKTGDPIDTIASTKQYSLPEDFGRMHTVLYRFVNGSTDITYNLEYITLVEFDYLNQDNTVRNADEIKYYSIYPGDSSNLSGYLKISGMGGESPLTAGLDLTPRYYKIMTDLDSFGDLTEVPLPTILENYALAQIFKIRKEEDKASYYDKLFREQIELLKLMQKKQVTQRRNLLEYKGRGSSKKLYGTRNFSNNDYLRENYF
jgi:hypothetical protein